MENGLKSRIDVDACNINLILSRCVEGRLVDGKQNILWQHLNYDQPLVQGMQNKFFVNGIDAFVYVSNWQYEKFRYIHNTPLDKSFVIKNAIEPISNLDKPKNEKIRLIYTSTPFRGLDILLDAFAMLNRDDVELHVYSSTIIYGSDYDKQFKHQYEPLFEKAQNMSNVVYNGYASNSDVIQALQQSHIFVYPSTFEETSCLALIEAGAAGCHLLTHNIGALGETASEFATLLPLKANRHQLVKQFAVAMNESIDSFWTKASDLKYQSDFFNTHYSWQKRIGEWVRLFEVLTTN